MRSAKKSATKPKPAFQGAVRLRKMPKIQKRPSTPHKRGARVGLGNVSGRSWSIAFGKGKAKTIRVGDMFMVKCTAPGNVKMVG